MNKRIIWFPIVMVLILVACRGGEENPSPTPEPATATPVIAEQPPADFESEVSEPVTIQFAVFDFEQGRYNDLIDSFEEENPDLEIKTVSIEEILELENLAAEWPEDAYRRMVSAADVSGRFFTQQAAQQGLLLDLEPQMAADPNFDVNDFYPNLLESYQFGGGTWAVPTDATFLLIYYDKDAFDEAELDYPEAGWSWDEFLATAKVLTERDGDEVVKWGFAEITPAPTLFVESRTGSLFDLDTDPPTAYLDSTEVADMMRWYTDLFLTHQVAPYFPVSEEGSSGLDIPEGYLLIENGQAAMWWDAASSWPIRSQQMNLGVVPFPVDVPDSATSRFIPNGLSISAGTAHPQAAWRWVDFLSRQTSELGIGIGDPTSVPARRSGAEASGFWDDVDPQLEDALRYGVDHAYISSFPPGSGEAFNDALTAILAEDKTVEQALSDAQVQVTQGIDESIAEASDASEEIVVTESETEVIASEDAVTIEFIAGAGPFEMQTFRDLANAYLNMNPEVVVEVKAPDFFDGTPTLADIANASDCFQWFPGNFNDPETTAAILSIDPFLDADPAVSKDDFFTSVLDSFISQGQTWGLPGQVNITLIEYNKDLFDEAGLDYPTDNWTTDQFLALAVALTQGESESRQYGYVSNIFEPSDLLSFLDRLGVNMIDDSDDPPALAFDDPTVVEAMVWFTALTTEHDVKPVLMKSLTDIAVGAVQEREVLLAEGRAAMWTNAQFDLGFGDDSGDGYQTGAVPLPVGPGGLQGSGFQSTSGYFISADTEAREACWQWISFLADQPNVGTALPAKIAVAESDAYQQHVGPQLANAYIASMTGAPKAPFSQQISDERSWMNYPIIWMYSAYGQILDSEYTVEQALNNAQQLADEYRACVIDADAMNNDDGQKTCMMEIDETIPSYIFGE